MNTKSMEYIANKLSKRSINEQLKKKKKEAKDAPKVPEKEKRTKLSKKLNAETNKKQKKKRNDLIKAKKAAKNKKKIGENQPKKKLTIKAIIKKSGIEELRAMLHATSIAAQGSTDPYAGTRVDFRKCPKPSGENEETRLQVITSWLSKELNGQPGPADIYELASYFYHQGWYSDSLVTRGLKAARIQAEGSWPMARIC